MSKNQKWQVAKISVFITSIFVIFLSVTYAFIHVTITGNRRQVITAGNLDLVLTEDENNLMITNALPMYDEVGMLQEAFTFRLMNRTSNPTNYVLKLIDITTGNKLNLTDVKYGLTKDGNSTIDLLSNIQNHTVDKGVIGGNQTIEYALRLWIKDSIEDEASIKDKSLNYKLEVEVSQEIPEIEETLGEAKDILFSENVQDDTCGTYDDGVDTFLVGQCKNNYVWYSGKLWRVVLKNNETGAVKMVTDNTITAIPYNPTNQPNFKDSFVDQWLQQEFLPTLHDYEDYLMTDSIWNATMDSSSSPTRPNGTTTVERVVGLLNYYEYYRTYQGGNTSALTGYLNNRTWWWLITPYSSNGVRHVDADGNANYYQSPTGPNGFDGVRPSVNLKSDIHVVSGNGSISEPFKLINDEQEIINGTTLLSTRYSGEYVKFNEELYRIVGVEDGLTKITAVDRPVSLAYNKYHNGGIISFATADIKNNLETYYQSLDAMTRNMIEKDTTWYLEMIRAGDNYKVTICKVVDANISMSSCEKTTKVAIANIGLPRVGEMFTGQITRGTKTSFWTLTQSSTSYVRVTYEDGRMGSAQPKFPYGGRPSVYLNSNIRLASDNTGDGTYEHPYEIELGE